MRRKIDCSCGDRWCSMSDAAQRDRQQGVLLYDGDCALCRKGVAQLRKLDWLGVLRYADARDPGQRPATDPPLDPARLLEEMHLLSPKGGRIYHGFGAFRWLAWRLPLLWP